ncbi:MAG: energy-coupling factor ABC transporter ATP-binding protein [Candidatus Dormibacteraeota bacterium]|nr:energy-coupling factor ABC transporter ATP-binding protein [Candidatus Dormibacteraeota bacterium]
MIRLRDVAYWYPGTSRPAIEHLSLEAEEGEIVGITGPNECGKTTVCLVASGLAPRVVGGRLHGSVEIPAGCTALLDSPSAQLSGLHRTVFQEVAFGPCNLGLSAAEAQARTWSAMEATGIVALAERHPEHLSGGERQLVALAGLVAMRPRHLILDEPLARLDEAGRLMVGAALQDLCQAGTGMIIAEHDTGFLARLGARTIAL